MTTRDADFFAGLVAGAAFVVIWMAAWRPLIVPMLDATVGALATCAKPKLLWARMTQARLDHWIVKRYAGGSSWYGVGYKHWFVGVQRWHEEAGPTPAPTKEQP